MKYKLVKVTKGNSVIFELYYDRYECGNWEYVAEDLTEAGIRRKLASVKENLRPTIEEIIEEGEL